jgi:endogenous inhibitor of DNA gyrase (YacG/DUF329 family)
VIVRVTCPACSDIAVTVSEVQVVRDPVGDRFRFHCPRCGVAVEKKAVGRVAEMLVAAGAAETVAAEAVALTPELSLDDLDALRRDLEAPDWLERLLA